MHYPWIILLSESNDDHHFQKDQKAATETKSTAGKFLLCVQRKGAGGHFPTNLKGKSIFHVFLLENENIFFNLKKQQQNLGQ